MKYLIKPILLLLYVIAYAYARIKPKSAGAYTDKALRVRKKQISHFVQKKESSKMQRLVPMPPQPPPMLVGRKRKSFLGQPAPLGYVPGLGRG